MISDKEIFETMGMVSSQHLDVRCITMGISLFDCITGSAKDTAAKVYDKIT
ncbi:MAG TPA: PFL family protein, partial [Clostridiales bacterium]|nr:PFL family protein [Clostridiales bacterium]